MPTPSLRAGRPGAGLCAECRHARAVETRRGSTFLLCERAAIDPRFVRYPPLPVLECTGYEVLTASAPDES